MLGFIIRRLLLLIPMLLGASVIVFLVLRLAPSDPAMDYLRLSYVPQARRRWSMRARCWGWIAL